MRKKIIVLLTITVISCLFIFTFFNGYAYIYNRIHKIVESKRLLMFYDGFDYPNMLEKALSKLELIFTLDNLKMVLNSVLSSFKVVLLSLLFISQFFMIIFFLILFELLKKNKKYKITTPSKVYLFIRKKIVDFFKLLIDKTKNYYLSNKKMIKQAILLLSILTMLLPIFLLELILILVNYVSLTVVSFSGYMVVFESFNFILFNATAFIIGLPLIIKIMLALFAVYKFIMYRTWKKLKKNHKKMKSFIDFLGQTTFINGAPSVGKTLSVSYFATIAEENYIDELESIIFSFEETNPTINMSFLRAKSKLEYDNFLNKENPIKSITEIIGNNDKQYNLQMNYLQKVEDLTDYIIAYDKLYYRESMVASTYPIVSAYYDTFSKKMKMNLLRAYEKADKLSLESYMVIAITELDKEFNSHDDKKVIGEEGVATAFATISHFCGRHVKIFSDYQCKDQVPKRIRGSVESFVHIKSNNKKYPLLLNLLIIKPTSTIYKLFSFLVKLYDGKKKKLEKMTLRKGYFKFKRNDYSLLYAFLRECLYLCYKIVVYFSQFKYIELSAKHSNDDDFKESKEFKYNINIMDLSYKNKKIYESCVLENLYDSIKEKINDTSGLRDMSTWKDLSATYEDFKELDMHFLDKFMDAYLKDNEVIKKDELM